MEISLTQQALLYLLNCAVNERIPDELPHEVDFEGLYKISKFHSVSAMVSCALDKGGYLSEAYMSQELIQKWAMARIHAMRKNLMFDAERAQILQWMEDQGCWYMPLKGVILKEMYPDVGMREMSDNDILIDACFRKELKEYMVERGYEVKSYERYIHDTYMKKPFYNFEFHVELFDPYTVSVLPSYYEGIKKKLLKDEENRSGYHFSTEDYYIYVTTHTYKHFSEGGIGIRFFVDNYVYLSRNGKIMNWDYIAQETIKLGINEFEERARELSKKIFNEHISIENIVPENLKLKEMLDYILESGTYGTQTNSIQNRMIRIQNNEDNISIKTKLKFVLNRLFPGEVHADVRKLIENDKKWLIPFFWLYRFFTALVINRKRILSEIRTLIKMK